LSDAAAAFLRGLKDKSKLRDFKNNHEAEPWVVYERERKEDVILALRDERPQGMVPSGGVVSAVTAGIDTQDNGFWFELRAWGWGQTSDSWQVRFGFVESFAALSEVLFGSEYRDADGVRHAVRFALIDSGGHRTSEVYDYCRQPHPSPVMPSKGQGRMSGLHTVGKIDVYPGTTKPIPGGVRLLNLAVNQYKDALDGRLKVSPADPGAWRMCAECSDEWARQMTAEVIDEKTGQWINPKGRPNHAWDCSVLNMAAADFIGIRFWPRPAPKRQDPAAAVNMPTPTPWIGRGAGAGSWIARR
jgi:phage terminase large subunit GpA-like protein